VADRKEERAARNRDLVAGMGASPTRAQILADFDFEIGDALQLAVAANLQSLVRLLQMAKLEMSHQRRADFNDKS
jgi:hypothetical protein